MNEFGALAFFNLVLMHLLPGAFGMALAWVLLPLGGAGRRSLSLGLGLALGMPLAAMSIWLADRAGWSLTGNGPVLMLCGAGLVLIGLAWVLRVALRPATAHSRCDATSLAFDRRRIAPIMVWVLAILVLFRLATLLPDLLLRPVFPWDAWKLWAWKARVWFEAGALVPFLPPSEWLAADGGQYVMDGVDHPDFVSLLMLWSALSLGSWDDSLIGLFWLLAGVASALISFGLLRHLGTPVALAWLGVYLLLSAPMLATHVALFGYADLWVMLYFLVFVAGLVLWVRQRSWPPLVVLLVGGTLMALTKDTGVYWLPVLVAAWLAVVVPDRLLFVLIGAVAVSALVLGLLGMDPLAVLSSGRYTLDVQEPGAALRGMARHMFIWLDWHLAWFLAPVVLVMAALCAGRSRELRALLLVSLLSIGFSIFGFLLSRAGEYAVMGTLFSRVLLQFYPVLVLLAVVTLWQWLRRNARQEVADAAPVA